MMTRTLNYDAHLRASVENFWPSRLAYPRDIKGSFVKKNGLKTYRLLENGKISEEGIRKCIERATIDITTRTMRSIHKAKSNWMYWFAMEIADEGKLYENIVEWLSRSASDISSIEYDKWHHKACMEVLAVIQKNYKNKDNSDVNYGKAQKVVSMAMKTVYCLLLSEPYNVRDDYEPYFEHCHMPLDRIILDGWLDLTKSGHLLNASEKYDGKKRTGWSYINYSNGTYDANGKYSYTCLVAIIRDLFDQTLGAEHKSAYGNVDPAYFDYTPFQAEFLIWIANRSNFYSNGKEKVGKEKVHVPDSAH